MNFFFLRRLPSPIATLAMLFSLLWMSLGLAPGVEAADAANGREPAPIAFPSEAMEIVTTAGKRYRFQVELALSPAQQRRGLMFRKTLAPDAAMLFDYNPPRPITMWMKNTVLSLDMLFFDVSGRISGIVERTTPYSQDLITVPGLTRYVLEVPAGTAARLGLGVGDKLSRR